jgi:hypothetical protein
VSLFGRKDELVSVDQYELILTKINSFVNLIGLAHNRRQKMNGYYAKSAQAFAVTLGLKYVTVEEDWSKRTVKIVANNLDGSVTATFTEHVLAEMQRRFGSTSFTVEARPDGRYTRDRDYDYAVGVYLHIIIQNVTLPEAPA